jgi:uncharacterized protein YjbI with pentapeptide repeats
MADSWPTCNEDGCSGACIGDETRCLAHARARKRGATLKRFSKGGGLDVRGVTISDALFGEIVAAAPHDADGNYREFSAALFYGATFEGDVSFYGATFEDAAQFDKATFKGDAHFFDAVSGKATFFKGDARFDRATFEGVARFDKATFKGLAMFDGATFKGDAQFFDVGSGKATFFKGDAWFDKATFEGTAWF